MHLSLSDEKVICAITIYLVQDPFKNDFTHLRGGRKTFLNLLGLDCLQFNMPKWHALGCLLWFLKSLWAEKAHIASFYIPLVRTQ